MMKTCWQWACMAMFGFGLMASVCLSGCKKDPVSPPIAAVPVVASEVLVRDATNFLENIGETLGGQDVEIRARAAGFLESVNFTEGKTVQSNELLYVIDDRPFKAALAQGEGVLAQVNAAWEKSRQDTNRLGPLWEKNAISRQQFDDALAAERSAAANVQAAQAGADTARIQLGYTKIYAPLDGIAGKNEVGVGNLVGQGQNTLLTTISDISSINVRFSVSEQVYLEFRRKGATGSDGKGMFELILADGSLHPFRNSAVFADRQVDPRTGTLLLQVQFPNPDKVIRPGQFARVRFPAEVFPSAILVPQRCVQEMQAIYSVFVVSAENKAEFRKITLGPRLGTFYVVKEGLKAGEKIVLDGIQKLQNGVPMAVTMTNLASEMPATKSAEAK